MQQPTFKGTNPSKLKGLLLKEGGLEICGLLV